MLNNELSNGEEKMFDLMSIKDFAKEINKPESTVRTWKRRGDIPQNVFKEIGGTVFVRTDKFKEWISNEE